MGISCTRIQSEVRIRKPKLKSEIIPKRFHNVKFQECCFKSGHNSYIKGNQIGGRADYQILLNCLELGCRVIELDIAGIIDGVIMIGHCARDLCGTTLIVLENALRLLNKYAWKKSNYPLILCFDIKSDDVSLHKEIRPMMRRVFKGRFYSGEIMKSTTIGELVGRVGIYPKSSPDFKSYPSHRTEAINRALTSKKVIRVYPNNIISSKNYNPVPLFVKGVQVVAINWNTEDVYRKRYEQLLTRPIMLRKTLMEMKGKNGK